VALLLRPGDLEGSWEAARLSGGVWYASLNPLVELLTDISSLQAFVCRFSKIPLLGARFDGLVVFRAISAARPG